MRIPTQLPIVVAIEALCSEIFFDCTRYVGYRSWERGTEVILESSSIRGKYAPVNHEQGIENLNEMSPNRNAI
jgi:hypothetical protein